MRDETIHRPYPEQERDIVALHGDDEHAAEAAFERFYRDYHKYLCNIARRYETSMRDAGSPLSGEDIVQTCWSKLWNGRDRYVIGKYIYKYMERAVINGCLNAIRDAQNRKTYPKDMAPRMPTETDIHETFTQEGTVRTEPVDTTPSPEDIVISSERKALIRTLIEEAVEEVLTKHQRFYWKLHYSHGLSLDEIEEWTGTPRATIKSHHSQARKRMRPFLAERLKDAGYSELYPEQPRDGGTKEPAKWRKREPLADKGV